MDLVGFWFFGAVVTWIIASSQAGKHEIGGIVVLMIAICWFVTVPFAVILWLMEALTPDEY